MSTANDDVFKRFKVSELMSHEVLSISKTTTLQEAIRIMVQKGIRHLPVVEDGAAVAVLSDRDVRMKVTDLFDPEERRRYLESTPVTAHASHPVTTATADMLVAEAAKIFVESRIGCLPVVDENGKMIGIVTQTDLLKWLAQAVEE